MKDFADFVAASGLVCGLVVSILCTIVFIVGCIKKLIKDKWE